MHVHTNDFNSNQRDNCSFCVVLVELITPYNCGVQNAKMLILKISLFPVFPLSVIFHI